MAIGDDLSCDGVGNIRWTGGLSTYYSVLEVHRWAQSLAASASAVGDDQIDITKPRPSARATDTVIRLLPPYNIDDDVAEHLYGGSITQNNGDEIYAGLAIKGSVHLPTTFQVVQNNAMYDGAAPFWGTGINPDPTQGILCQFLVKVRTAAADIDGRRVRVFAREFGDTYAEVSITMGLGNNVVEIETVQDLNNQTVAGVVATWVGITNVEGFQQIDLGNWAGAKNYFSKWTRGAYTINQLYERVKWLTRRGSVSLVYGMVGELFRGITHQWAYQNEAGGPFTQNEILSWGAGATAGTGALLALDDDGATGSMWIQLLTGIAPSAGMTVTGLSSGATADLNGAPTARTIGETALGKSNGANVSGAYGVGIQAADLANHDQLIDLDNTLQAAPNLVQCRVEGLVVGEDYVLVGPKGAGDEFDIDQLSADAGNLIGNPTLVVKEAIPIDTPLTGTVRVYDSDDNSHPIAYTSWSGSTFTLSAGLPFTIAEDSDVWISYLDKVAGTTEESCTFTFNTDRDLWVQIRDGGATPTKGYENAHTLEDTGVVIANVRESDL